MYQVIARKYRPQTFEHVLGQSHVKQTLRNAIAQGRIAHAYIFSGPRGTGKTTTARILAMALNCEQGPSATPDPDSPICQEIAAGGALDVVEIDAASNRGIDSMRQLRESVQFRPVRDRYKVFIIDEAHQITPDAFNALLKTLEEPPEWMVFVLCTTEPQAIPATILSRCQHFAFHAVAVGEVLTHLGRICDSEGVSAEDDALTAIALAGDGSVRDSLSALDQAIAAFGGRLEADSVRDLLGVISGESADRILAAIRDGDQSGILAAVDELLRHGGHPQHFCGELARYFRNLLVMKLAGTDSRLAVAGAREREVASEWLEHFSEDDLTRFVSLLLSLYGELQDCTHQRFRLEIGLLKLVHAGRLAPIEEVLDGLGKGASARPSAPPSRPSPAVPSARPPGPVAPSASPPAPAPAPKAPALRLSRQPSTLEDRLLDSVRENRTVTRVLKESEIKLEGDALQVRVPRRLRGALALEVKVLEAAAVAVTGKQIRVRLESKPAAARGGESPGGAPSRPAQSPGQVSADAASRAKANAAVQAITSRHPGRVVKVVDLRD